VSDSARFYVRLASRIASTHGFSAIAQDLSLVASRTSVTPRMAIEAIGAALDRLYSRIELGEEIRTRAQRAVGELHMAYRRARALTSDDHVGAPTAPLAKESR
jgi:hypothetical protein